MRLSTALRTIAGEYFTDELADLGSKDAAMQTRGVWIIELSELDNLSRAEVARIKAFMSRTTDRFRPPYGMRLVESPRQCVFAGTVNHGSYLRDETGGRLFWPVVCGRTTCRSRFVHVAFVPLQICDDPEVIKVRHVMHGQAGQVSGDFASKYAGTLTEPLECHA